MDSKEWIEAVRQLTKDAYEQAPGKWKDFERLVMGPMRAEEVANNRRVPNRAFAYKLVLCIYQHGLGKIPAIIGEAELRAQFQDPTHAEGAALGTDTLEDDEPETLPVALHLSGAERATEFYSGRYLLFVNGDEGIAVYICVLKAMLGPDGTPRYIMWRNLGDNMRRVYRGGYFVSDDHLYLLGGRPEALDLRMVILRVHNAERGEYEGQTLFVNSRNTIVSCRAYLAPHRTRVVDLPEALIGLSELEKLDSNAHQYFSMPGQFILHESRGMD